jgi:hypothetical protein
MINNWKQMIKIAYAVAGILTILFVNGCHNQVKQDYIYPNNSKISSFRGYPADSQAVYFPAEIKLNGKQNITEVPDYTQKWLAEILFVAHEPILYNYYTGTNIYRFICAAGKGLPVIISICREKDSVWLISKILNRDMKHPYRYIIFKINDRKELSLKEWDAFEQLLGACNFWDMNPTSKEITGKDGAEFFIEAHLANSYWFVERWCPSGKYKSCCDYLIKLSGLKAHYEKMYHQSTTDYLVGVE